MNVNGAKIHGAKRMEKPVEKSVETPVEKPANTKPLETTAKEAEAAASVEDIVAPDPDKP